MNQQDRISATSAFWREMLDQLPTTAFIFRIDESEDAKLFFVNKQLVGLLGFKPEEYVLGSESEGFIAKELKMMVDEIARLSHNREGERTSTMMLTTKDGSEKNVKFYFRLFKPKSSSTPFITVSITENTSGDVIRETKSENFSLFTAESQVMQNLLTRLYDATNSNDHIFLWGESGTGKNTLINRCFTTLNALGKRPPIASVSFKNCSKKITDKLKAPVEHIIGEPEILLHISHFEDVNMAHIQWLDEIISTRNVLNMSTRLFVTSQKTLEQLASEQKISAEFMFTHPFNSTAVPPLRYRKEDIGVIAQKWIKIHEQTFPGISGFSDSELKALKKSEWKGNLPELFSTLSKLTAGLFYESQSSSKTEIKEEKIIPFDEMCAQYLEKVLTHTDGKIYGKGGAAELLDMKPTTLQSKLKKLNVR